MPDPTISVIIPACNAAAFISEAIESVLAQTLLASEIIVVDDGSTDDTASAVRAFQGVTLLQQPNKGAAAARNRGFAAAGGEFIALLDADDLWLPEKLSRQAAILETRPEVDMASCGIEQFSDYDHIPVEPRFAVLHGRSGSTLLFRRQMLERVGPMDESLRASEIVGWLMVADDAGIKHVALPDVLARRRLHPGSLARIHKDTQAAEYLSMLRRRLVDGRKSNAD